MKNNYTTEDLTESLRREGRRTLRRANQPDRTRTPVRRPCEKRWCARTLDHRGSAARRGSLARDLQNEERFDVELDDDGHEGLARASARPLFGQEVARRGCPCTSWPTRWRCTTDPDYYESLSSDVARHAPGPGAGLLQSRRRPSASKRTPVSKARSPCVRGTRRPKSRAWTQERYVITKSCSRVFLFAR